MINDTTRQESLLLCRGRVMHARLRPFVHRFVYRVFCLRLRLDQPDDLARYNSWLFGVERARPVSFRACDHGARDGTALLPWLVGVLEASELRFERGAVWLQCFPRVFGYVFNPVSFWLIHDKGGELRALLAEVNNTFGQRHQYLLTAPNAEPIQASTKLSCKKVFHVSPFCAVQGLYEFELDERAGQPRLAIDYFDSEQELSPLLRTAIVVRPEPLRTRALLAALLSMPMMTFGVMLRIHLQAFKLWRQGAKYRSKPPLPQDEVTHNFKL
ncbi:MAG: DUF1365 domain-containing protein [Alcaligenaceae bacterium]|nr:DUF1365 domain-containing protein [Alcaligenaceae bacterium]